MWVGVDTEQYGAPHEHKGPADFAGKRDLDDDDDEDVDEAAIQEQMTSDPNLAPHLQPQAGYSHMRHALSASPPMINGAVPYHQRQHTPQPQMGSRPASRNQNPNIPRPGSNLGHHQVPHAPNVPNGYAYRQNQSIYPPPGSMPVVQHPGQPQQSPPVFQYPPQPHPHPQMQQGYLQDGSQPMPPAYPPNGRGPAQLQPQQPLPQRQPTPQRQSQSPPQQEPERRPNTNTLQPQQPKPVTDKSRSIFTPIDDSRSLLAAHWGIGSSSSEPRHDMSIKQEKDGRSQSVDVATVQRSGGSGPVPPPARPQRVFSQPQRTQSMQSVGADGKRPKLKVQIPSEQSDDGESATAGSSPRQSEGTAGETPAKGTETSHSSGVVLPPPSPSASALLSAGAQGPPNPFARPLPPNAAANQNNQAYGGNNNIETPMSALPSRFAEGLLPSPSSFYPEWGFSRSGDSNMLPSPLNFQTPIVGNGPSFPREEEVDRKRKSPEGEGHQDVAGAKRIKA